MTKEKFNVVFEGLLEILNEAKKSPKYDELDASITYDLGILQNRIETGLFIHLYKCLFEKDDE